MTFRALTRTLPQKTETMKNIYITFCTLLFASLSHTQTVAINDNNFVSYLQMTVPACMNGNALNISCANNSNITQMIIDNQGLTDLSGIEHFTSLTLLFCGMNEISNIPALPPNLEQFIAGYNQLTTLPELPSSLILLDCSHNQISNLPLLPNGLTELMCFNNQLTTLNDLPNSLSYIVASNNHITTINSLPNQLTYFDIAHNALNTLPELPNTLTMLSCANNQLTALPELPNLLSLFADSNNIHCFPTFPSTINAPILDFVFLTISGNPFTCLPNHIEAMTDDLLAVPICASSPNIDVYNCASSVGFPEDQIEWNVYPNPNNGSFKLKLMTEAQIEIRNTLGQNIAYSLVNNGDFQYISIENQKSGLYIVHINTLNATKSIRISVVE